MELQENSDGYTYKDGLLTSDIFSFANANGNLSGNEDRTHWATMGMYAKLNWNYQEVYFLEFSGRYDGSSVLLRDIVGDSSLLSPPVMIWHVPIISRDGTFRSPN